MDSIFHSKLLELGTTYTLHTLSSRPEVLTCVCDFLIRSVRAKFIQCISLYGSAGFTSERRQPVVWQPAVVTRRSKFRRSSEWDDNYCTVDAIRGLSKGLFTWTRDNSLPPGSTLPRCTVWRLWLFTSVFRCPGATSRGGLCRYQFDRLPTPRAPRGFCTEMCAQPRGFCKTENARGPGQ